MTFDKLFNLAGSIVVLAGVTVFLTSPRTADTIRAVGSSFSGVLRAATGR